MSNKLYEENDIQNIANAIRNKNGTEDTYKVSQMSTAIDSIEVIEQATAEGENLNLANTKAMPYSDYIVEGKSEQEGEPSPSNPSDIHSVADDVNLFDKDKTSINSGSVKTIIDTGVRITLSSSGTFRYSGIEIGGTELLGKTITLYSTITPSSNNDGAIFLYYGNSSNMAVSAVSGGGLTSTGSKTITLANEFPTNCDRVYGLFYANRNGTGNANDYVDYTNLKIQYGDTATPYSPYNQGTVTIKQRGTTENNNYTIKTEPLRSLPNGVKDTIEADGIHRRVGRIVLDGTQPLEIVNWRPTETSVGWVYPKSITNNKKQTEGVINNILCNKLKAVSYAYLLGNTVDEGINIVTQSNAYGLVIKTKDTSLTTANAINTYLSSNPITVQYELATEIIEPFTQQQATTYLDIIKTGSYEDTTNIYTDEDVKPTIGVDYYKKG